MANRYRPEPTSATKRLGRPHQLAVPYYIFSFTHPSGTADAYPAGNLAAMADGEPFFHMVIQYKSFE